MVSTGQPAPSGLSAEESRAYEDLLFLYTKGIGYATEMRTAPRRCTGWRIRRSRWRRG